MPVELQCHIAVMFRPGVWLDFSELFLHPDRLDELARRTAVELDLELRPGHSTPYDVAYSSSEQYARSPTPEPLWSATGTVDSWLHTEVTSLLADLAIDEVPADFGLSGEPVVRLYDFDVASLSIPATLRVKDATDAGIAVGALADAVCAASAPTVERISAAARKLASAEEQTGGIGSVPSGKPLWAHTVLQPLTPTPTDTSSGPQLDPDWVLPVHGPTVSHGDFHFTAGHQASTLVGAGPRESERVTTYVDRLHAWWTATWTLDQDLLVQAHAFEVAARSTDVHELTDLAGDVAYESQRVGLLLARYDTLQLNLGGLEWTIHEAQSTCWTIDNNLAAIGRKQQLLHDSHELLRTEVDARQSTRLGRIAAVFTVVTTLASVVAVWVFLFPGITDKDQPTTPRFGVLLATTFLGAVAVYWSYRAARVAFRRTRREPTLPGE